MRIDQIAGLAPGGADRGAGFGLVGAPGIEFLADRRQHRVGQHETSGLLQRRHQPANARRHRGRSASNNSRSKFEETWISIEGEAEA